MAIRFEHEPVGAQVRLSGQQEHFPPRQRLCMIAANNIREWSTSGISNKFKSSSSNIVAACFERNRPWLVAVADRSKVFVRSSKGIMRRFKLRTEQVRELLQLASMDTY